MHHGVVEGMDQIDMLGGEPYLRKIAVRELISDGLVPHMVFFLRIPQSPRAMVSDKGAMTTTALAGLGDGRRAGTGRETVLATAGPRSATDIGDRAFQQWRRRFASVPGPH